MRNLIILAAALSLSGGVQAAQSFDAVDTDNDGNVSRDEYYDHVRDMGTYSLWDTDGDGFVEEGEFNQLGYDTDYSTWDEDNNEYLDAGEFYDGAWGYYDDDDDDYWDNDEWNEADEDGFWDDIL